MSGLASKVLEQIRARQLLAAGARVVVAVSGGPDSMALLHLLQRLAPSNGWNLTVAHFNHRLRGRDSRRDEEFVRSYSEKNQIRAVFGSEDVAKLKHQSEASIEMMARRLRHEFLARVALESNCECLALGHHSDDQVELFFIRLIRGAGTEGLSGMSWTSPSPASPGVRLVRPLLGNSRAEILKYIRTHKIDHRLDASNQDTRILRNRIRHALLPLIHRAGFDIRSQVLEACDILASDAAFIAESTTRWEESRHCSFDALHCALQRTHLKRQLIEAEVSPSFRKVEFLRKNADKRLSVGKRKKLVRTGDGRIVLTNDDPNLPVKVKEETIQAEIGAGSGEGLLKFGGLMVRWRMVPAKPQQPSLTRDTQTEMFDADVVGSEIRLRYWRPGDRFQPIGLGKEAKIQDLFTNAKWGRPHRHAAVFAESQSGQLFWVQGLRISEIFKITPATKRILVWRWEPV